MFDRAASGRPAMAGGPFISFHSSYVRVLPSASSVGPLLVSPPWPEGHLSACTSASTTSQLLWRASSPACWTEPSPVSLPWPEGSHQHTFSLRHHAQSQHCGSQQPQLNQSRQLHMYTGLRNHNRQQSCQAASASWWLVLTNCKGSSCWFFQLPRFDWLRMNLSTAVLCLTVVLGSSYNVNSKQLLLHTSDNIMFRGSVLLRNPRGIPASKQLSSAQPRSFWDDNLYSPRSCWAFA